MVRPSSLPIGAGNSSGAASGPCLFTASSWVSDAAASKLPRKSRLTWPFANWSSLFSMKLLMVLPLVLVYTRVGPKKRSFLLNTGRNDGLYRISLFDALADIHRDQIIFGESASDLHLAAIIVAERHSREVNTVAERQERYLDSS